MREEVLLRHTIAPWCLPVTVRFDLGSYYRKPRTCIVIAPHPDDDVIGMGGTMRLRADKGWNVFSVYVTDGSSRIFKKPDLQYLRRNEALAALKVVGARAGIFLDYKSGQILQNLARLVHNLRDVLCYFMPREIYLPSPLERHATHSVVTLAVIHAIKQVKNLRPRLWGYQVWSDGYGFPDRKAVDISSAIACKQKAVRQHRTQLKLKPYDTGIIGKNHYDAVFLHTHQKSTARYVELFVDLQPLLTGGEHSFFDALLQRIKNSLSVLLRIETTGLTEPLLYPSPTKKNLGHD